MKSTILLVMSMLYCGSATATIWNVDHVLNGSDSGGFTFSVLHKADQTNPMSGRIFADIVSASGTYDDVSGELMFALGVSTDFDSTAEGILTLTNVARGNPVFRGGGDDFLDANSTLAYSLTPTTSSSLLASGGVMGFGVGPVCCTGSGKFAPNSFTSFAPGLHYMTLWGANFTGGLFDGNFNDGTTFGMDLRLGLSPVPAPAAVWLFGTALVGLFGYQRRKVLT